MFTAQYTPLAVVSRASKTLRVEDIEYIETTAYGV
jgi:hypothetical protein